MISMGNPVVAADGGFTPPGPGDFNLPPIGGGHETFDFLGQTHYIGVTKPMLQLVLAAVLVFGFFVVAARKRAMVPGRMQFVGEEAYGFIRNSVGRDIIGSHDFMRFVPYLFTLFFFILVNNLFATIPFIQFPTLSRAGMVYGLAAMSWVGYNAVGILAWLMFVAIAFLELLVQFLQAYVFTLLNALYISQAIAEEH